MIEIAFLGSGSSGNCAVVRSGQTVVLLDAGLSLRQTRLRLAERGVALESVTALFVTHDHSDHVRSALDLAKALGVPIYTSDGTARASGFPGPLFADWRRVKGGDEISLGGGELNVRVTSTPHDGKEPVCFVFADAQGRRAAVATDLGHLSGSVAEALAGAELLGIEANHDADLLRTGPYPPFLKRRILSDVGHLSNEAAADGLKSLVGPRTSGVVLLHLSQHNNTAALALAAARMVLDEIGARLPLEAARQELPTGWLTAGKGESE